MKWRLVFLTCVLGGCGSSEPAAPREAPVPSDGRAVVATPAAVAVAASADAPSVDKASRAAGAINPRLLRRFKPLRESMSDKPLDVKLVDLGRQLYYETRISRRQAMSCNSCHDLKAYGVDSRPTSVGFSGKNGSRNSPSTYHAAGQFAQFWDGRAADVEAQAGMPVMNAIEMGMPSPQEVTSVLASIPGYVSAFAEAFPGQKEPVTFENMRQAIGAFERGLVTPSRWDQFLRGQAQALTAKELEGFKTFSDLGCVVCHTGEFVGGSMYEKVGVVKAWPSTADKGRYEVTKDDTDKMTFKVPSLRNVAKTAPYFHDGSASTLEEAVIMMARHQLGEELGPSEVTAIATWLGSLTGEIPQSYIAAPVRPPGGPTTEALLSKLQ